MSGLPEPIVSLPPQLVSRYAQTDNPTRSVVDAQASAPSMMRKLHPLRDARAIFARMANRYRLTRTPEDAQAFAQLAIHWAQSGALTGFFNAGQDEISKRNHSLQQFNLSLTLSAVALAYAQVRDAVPASQTAMIDQWLRTVDNTLREPAEGLKPNNHAYWRGAAHAAVGYALHDPVLLDQGIASARTGIDSIDQDLLLPAELQRGQRALDYHFFATMPLVLIAELAPARGVDLYTYQGGALRHMIEQRLIPALEGNLDVIELVAQRAQATPQLAIKQTNLPMLAMYHYHFPSQRTEAAVNAYLQLLQLHPNTEVQEEKTLITTGTPLQPDLNALCYPALGGHIAMIMPRLRERHATSPQPLISGTHCNTTVNPPLLGIHTNTGF
jgi:hypothetical protein